MKRNSIIIVLLSSLFLMGCEKPPVTLHDSVGGIASPKDKWVLLSYWADWCENCADEVPELNRFYAHHASNVLFYGVNYDQLPKNQLVVAMKKMHMTYPSLLDNPSSIWSLDMVDLIPVLFVINPQGQVVKKIVGPVTAKQLEKLTSKAE